MGEEYKCTQCGETFDKGWSDKEAMGESVELFGDVPVDNLAIICDGCFKKMFPPDPKIKVKQYGVDKFVISGFEHFPTHGINEEDEAYMWFIGDVLAISNGYSILTYTKGDEIEVNDLMAANSILIAAIIQDATIDYSYFQFEEA